MNLIGCDSNRFATDIQALPSNSHVSLAQYHIAYVIVTNANIYFFRDVFSEVLPSKVHNILASVSSKASFFSLKIILSLPKTASSSGCDESCYFFMALRGFTFFHYSTFHQCPMLQSQPSHNNSIYRKTLSTRATIEMYI